VSVHGANRLGGNSLLDLVVFGRATGLHLGEALAATSEGRAASQSDIDAALARTRRWEDSKPGQGEDPAQIKKDLQQCMQLNFSVFREGKAMAEGLEQLKEIRERLKFARLDDKSSDFNTQRIECLELDNLMEVAEATAIAALERKESRGAHSRYDYPDRDDVNWLKHSLYFPATKELKKRDVNFKPKTVDTFEPKVRTY
jgi:succinate dehydrogenase / fumarate reductase flavoprotein subunit